MTISLSPLRPLDELPLEEPTALIESDQSDAATSKLLLEQWGDHAACPRAPVDRHDSSRPAAVQLVGELAEDLARRRVVRLAAIAEPAGHGAEQDEEAQAVGAQMLSEGHGCTCLGRHHPLERVGLLVADELVLDHPGTVHHTVDAAVLLVDGVDQAGEGPLIGDIADAVVDPGTGRA